MSDQRIRRLVFRIDGVLIDDEGRATRDMPALLSELAESLDLWAAGSRKDCDHLATLTDYRGALVAAHIVELADGPIGEVLDGLVVRRVIEKDRTVWVDWHPRQAMTAIRRGLDAALFEDAARLYRDLGLWGLVALIPDLEQVRAHLGSGGGGLHSRKSD